MKKFVPIFLLPIFLVSCGGTVGFQLSDAQITIAVQAGTSAAFQYVLKDNAKRTDIAKYVSAIAGVARTATGKETPDELAKALLDAVPVSVQTAIPEIGTMVVPLVVSFYQTAKAKYGTDYPKLYSTLNAVATGLENGVAPFVTK